jgi:glycosyltransferase involved in cell wall biosynthesis
MERDHPLISIVIPTRERIETLRSTISTALDQKSQRFEVLISDNASADGTAEFVSSIADGRLRYVNTGQRLSMSANWDFALEHARGDYVLIIGDDDAVLPGALDRLIIDMERNPSDVYSWPKHVYVWPDSGRGAYVESLAAQADGHSVDLAKLSMSVLAMGGWGHYSLPSMYHSLVARRIPDEMRQRFGHVYHAALPDVFMALCVPAFVAAAWNVGYSVTAHGRSSKSNGWVATPNQQPIQIQRFIKEYGDYHLHPSLYPDVPVMANLAPDAVLVARDLFADHYKRAAFGYEAMWALICREARVFKWRVSPRDVVRRRASIRKYHRLRLVTFAEYLAWHGAHAIYSRIATRRTTSTAARDIGTFVRDLSHA